MPMPALLSATPRLLRNVDEVEPERAAGLVQVEPVRVLVVCDVEVASRRRSRAVKTAPRPWSYGGGSSPTCAPTSLKCLSPSFRNSSSRTPG